MLRLGKAINLTPSQCLVIKAEKTPKIGSAVIDESLTVVGTVFDIIGPVSSPYAVIRPSVKTPEKLLNKQLYLGLSQKGRSPRE